MSKVPFAVLTAAMMLLGLPIVIACTYHDSDFLLQKEDVGIIGGLYVDENDPIRPVVAVLKTKTNSCTAIVVAKNVVLTASHCVKQEDPQELVFSNGSRATQFPQVVTHPLANTDLHDRMYDFALIRFAGVEDRPVFAQLSTLQTDPKKGEGVWIAGFGTGVEKAEFPDYDTLHKIPVQIHDPNYSEVEIEVAEPGFKGACAGDSGGPGYLVQGNKIVVWGVDSMNSRNSLHDCHDFELYSRVSNVLPWIDSVIASMTKDAI